MTKISTAARPRMVAMGMRNNGLVNRTPGIYIEQPPRAIQSFVGKFDQWHSSTTSNNRPHRLLVHGNDVPIHLFDKIDLFVLEIVQRHRLPVEKDRRDLEVVKNLELLLSDAAAKVLAVQEQ